MASERWFGRIRYLATAATIVAVAGATVVATGAAQPGRPPLLHAAAAALAGPTDIAWTASPSAPTTDPSPSSSASPASSAPEVLPTPPAPSDSVALPTPAPTPRATPKPAVEPTPEPPAAGWVTVLNDGFDSGSLPGRWESYDGPYGSGPGNCAIPSHAVVSGGYLHLIMSYESSSSLPCGPGWYTGGIALSGYSGVDQRITVRFRVVDSGVAGHFIIPMRWPDGSGWPAAGEEDYCESDSASGCTTFLHYGADNSQNQHDYSVDLSQWHTLRFQRLNHVVSTFIDNMTTPVWTFKGDSATLPDTLKHVVLQQECHESCPDGTQGSEDIQIDWITVDQPR